MARVLRDRDPTGSPWLKTTMVLLTVMDTRTERVSPPIAHARKNADGSWYVAVTWGNGRKEQLGPYKTEAVKNSSKRSWPHGMRAKSYFGNRRNNERHRLTHHRDLHATVLTANEKPGGHAGRSEVWSCDEVPGLKIRCGPGVGSLCHTEATVKLRCSA